MDVAGSARTLEHATSVLQNVVKADTQLAHAAVAALPTERVTLAAGDAVVPILEEMRTSLGSASEGVYRLFGDVGGYSPGHRNGFDQIKSLERAIAGATEALGGVAALTGEHTDRAFIDMTRLRSSMSAVKHHTGVVTGMVERDVLGSVQRPAAKFTDALDAFRAAAS